MRSATLWCRSVVFCVVVGALATSCNSNPNQPGGGNPAFEVNGSWVGATTGGAKFSFTVAGNAVTFFTISQIPACAGNIFGFGASAAITNNAFSHTTSGGIVVGTVTGTFSSATAASGNASLTFSQGCPAGHTSAWTAAKQ